MDVRSLNAVTAGKVVFVFCLGCETIGKLPSTLILTP